MTIADLFNDNGFIFVTQAPGVTQIYHRFKNNASHATSLYELAGNSVGIPERDLVINNQITENFFGTYYGRRFFLDTDPNSENKQNLSGAELEITKYLINPGLNGKNAVYRHYLNPADLTGIVKINRITNNTTIYLIADTTVYVKAIDPIGQDGGQFIQGDRILFLKEPGETVDIIFQNTTNALLGQNLKLRGVGNSNFILNDATGFSIEFEFDLKLGNPYGSSWRETFRNSL